MNPDQPNQPFIEPQNNPYQPQDPEHQHHQPPPEHQPFSPQYQPPGYIPPHNNPPQYYPQPQPMVVTSMPIQGTNPQIIYEIPNYLTTPKGRRPEQFYCIACRKHQVSDVHHEMGTGSWLWTMGFFFVFLPLSCCPCCVEDCQDAVHTCPECGREVGKNRFCGI